MLTVLLLLLSYVLTLFKKVEYFKHCPNMEAFGGACHDLLMHTDCSGLCSLDPA